MTPWQIAGIAFGLVVYPLAWFWGGRPERLGAGVLLFSCLLSMATFYRGNLASMLLDGGSLLIFGWLCFRSDRWWPFVAAASGVLTALLYVIMVRDPAFSQYALVSAQIGLEFLIDLALLLGVCERALAGKPPAGPGAWIAANRATAARPGGRKKVPAERTAVRNGEALPPPTDPHPTAQERRRQNDGGRRLARSPFPIRRG